MVKPGKKNGRHYTKIRYKVRHRDIHANLERSWLCNLKYFLYKSSLSPINYCKIKYFEKLSRYYRNKYKKKYKNSNSNDIDIILCQGEIELKNGGDVKKVILHFYCYSS